MHLAKPNIGYFLLLFTCFALMTLGGVMLFISARDFYFARRSERWPAASGTVTASRLERVRGVSVRFLGGMQTAHAFEYAYTVRGIPFRGDRLAFMARNFSRGPEYGLARYPSGCAVRVRYDPGDPRMSVIEPGGDFRTLLPLFALGVGFLAAGAALPASIMHRARNGPARRREGSTGG